MSLSDELRKMAKEGMSFTERLREAPQSTTSGVPKVQMPQFKEEKPTKVPVSVPTNVPSPTAHPFEEEVQFGASLYPEVPPEMIKVIMGMESDTGKNASNKEFDAGEYGYLSGITKTGAFGDMIKNQDSVPYKVFEEMGEEAKLISSPKAAAAVTASIVAQIIRNKGVVPDTLENAWKLYNEHYKTLLGAKPTKKMKDKFTALWNEYSQGEEEEDEG